MSEVDRALGAILRKDKTKAALIAELVVINDNCQAVILAACQDESTNQMDNWDKVSKYVFSDDVSVRAKTIIESLGITFDYYVKDYGRYLIFNFTNALKRVVESLVQNDEDQEVLHKGD